MVIFPYSIVRFVLGNMEEYPESLAIQELNVEKHYYIKNLDYFLSLPSMVWS
jgi:hypothetical protein